MTSTTEQNLNELLQNCADEPIRIPGAIQPHGALLTVDELSWTVQQASANASRMLSGGDDLRAGQPLSAWIGEGEGEAQAPRSGRRWSVGGHPSVALALWQASAGRPDSSP